MIDGFFDLVSNMSLANELKWFLLLYFIRQIFVYFVFFSFVKCKSHTHRYMKWDKITHVYSTSSRFFICYCFVELQVLFLIFGFVVVVIIHLFVLHFLLFDVQYSLLFFFVIVLALWISFGMFVFDVRKFISVPNMMSLF